MDSSFFINSNCNNIHPANCKLLKTVGILHNNVYRIAIPKKCFASKSTSIFDAIFRILSEGENEEESVN